MADAPQAFADARVVSIFPTCFWLHDLKPEDYGPINAAIIPKINALIEPRAETIGGGVWQTHHDLHRLPEFARLTAFMRTAAAAAFWPPVMVRPPGLSAPFSRRVMSVPSTESVGD